MRKIKQTILIRTYEKRPLVRHPERVFLREGSPECGII